MYRKYRIVECIASSVSQYESYRDQVYRYTPKQMQTFCQLELCEQLSCSEIWIKIQKFPCILQFEIAICKMSAILSHVHLLLCL